MGGAAHGTDPGLISLLRALGDDQRLELIRLLCHGPLCVCHVQVLLGAPQSTVSRQLGILRRAGVVTARRTGTWVHYQLAAQPDVTRRGVVEAIVKGLRSDRGAARRVAAVIRRLGPAACR